MFDLLLKAEQASSFLITFLRALKVSMAVKGFE